MATKGLLKYHIVSTLWEGQSSIIYRATNLKNEFVALKMLLPGKGGRSAIKAMQREADIAQQMRHPNIVGVLEFVKDANFSALVMEYYECENLKSRLLKSPAFVVEHAHSIITQAASALAYVNQKGYVHRDMKPENVLVADSGKTKIIDFALAEEIGKKWRFFKPAIAGTRPYIAPETILRKTPDARTDIYSFGVTIYEMLTGRPPFICDDRDDILRKHLYEQPVSIRASKRNVSHAMNELVMQMLEKKPDLRPNSFEEVLKRMKDITVYEKQQ